MIGIVAAKELRELRRDRRIVALIILLALLALASAFISAAEQARYQRDRDAAAQQDRVIWNSQGEINPHSAAHFGMYAFRPRPPLALFDPALLPWQGEAIWIEAHYQNPAQARPAEVSQLVQRFGDLSPAWMLQVLLPLIIIIAGFGAIAGERENGTLRLQLGQGASPGRLVLGKGLSLAAVSLVVLALALGTSAVVAASLTEADGDALARAALLFVTYSIYALMWVALTLAVSAWSRSARQALVILLALWAIGAVLAPRLAADMAARAYPVSSAGQFWADVREAQRQGIDGHDPSSERADALKQATLRRYGVSRVEDLPFDFAGITLQAGEDYSNQVFDRFWGEEQARERAEVRSQLWFAPLSPLVALRPLSAGIAGSDTLHQHAFIRAAETHRRAVQLELNRAQMLTGRGQNFKNKMPADYWRRIASFDYEVPGIEQAIQVYFFYALILLAWLALAALLLVAATRRLGRRA